MWIFNSLFYSMYVVYVLTFRKAKKTIAVSRLHACSEDHRIAFLRGTYINIILRNHSIYKIPTKRHNKTYQTWRSLILIKNNCTFFVNKKRSFKCWQVFKYLPRTNAHTVAFWGIKIIVIVFLSRNDDNTLSSLRVLQLLNLFTFCYRQVTKGNTL